MIEDVIARATMPGAGTARLAASVMAATRDEIVTATRVPRSRALPPAIGIATAQKQIRIAADQSPAEVPGKVVAVAMTVVKIAIRIRTGIAIATRIGIAIVVRVGNASNARGVKPPPATETRKSEEAGAVRSALNLNRPERNPVAASGRSNRPLPPTTLPVVSAQGL